MLPYTPKVIVSHFYYILFIIYTSELNNKIQYGEIDIVTEVFDIEMIVIIPLL